MGQRICFELSISADAKVFVCDGQELEILGISFHFVWHYDYRISKQRQ